MVEHNRPVEAPLVSLGDFAAYCRGQGARDRNPMYIFDECFGDEFWESHELIKDYEPPALCDDLFAIFSEESRPPHRWLLVGPRRSGSFPHQDMLGTSAWNAVVAGRKRWVMLPPEVAEEVVHVRHTYLDEPDVYGWFDDLPEVLRRLTPEQLARTVDFVAGPGDVVWIPAGWWHAALNLSPWTVAVTENFVAIHEAEDGRRFLSPLSAEALLGDEDGVAEQLREALAGSTYATLLDEGKSMVS